MVKVTNLSSNCAAVVRINDRGPYKKGRIIDLSKAAARQLKMIGAGTASVQVEVVGLAGR
jgi:rare lipoprotein A